MKQNTYSKGKGPLCPHLPWPFGPCHACDVCGHNYRSKIGGWFNTPIASSWIIVFKTPPSTSLRFLTVLMEWPSTSCQEASKKRNSRSYQAELHLFAAAGNLGPVPPRGKSASVSGGCFFNQKWKVKLMAFWLWARKSSRFKRKWQK